MNSTLLKKRNQAGLVLLIVLIVSSGFVRDNKRVLIIGDSISIGYTAFMQDYFDAKTVIEHNPGNAQHTGKGLKNVSDWVGEGNWDIVQFNWGLWDLCYRHPDSKVFGNRDKINGVVTYPLEVYEANLDTLVTLIKQATDAKLIFVTTTYVPAQEPGRKSDDVLMYNEAAKRVMQKHDVTVNDIYESSVKIHEQFGKGSKDVHYTKEGYQKLSKKILRFLKKELRSN